MDSGIKTNSQRLEVTDAVQISDNKIFWYEQTERMGEQRWPKQLIHWIPSEKHGGDQT